MMVLNGEDGLACEVRVDGMRLNHVRNLNNWVMFWINRVQMMHCRMKVASGRRVAVDIRSLVNVRGLQLQCARFLNEALVVPVLMYNSDTMICKVN